MNLKTIFLILASAAYSYLFYQQSAGINFFIFTLVIIAFMIIAQPEYLKSKVWCIVAAGSVLSGLAIVWQHYPLGIIANVCSLILVMGLGYTFQTSLYLGFIKGGLSCFFSFFIKTFRVITDSTGNEYTKNYMYSFFKKLFMFYVLPLGITSMFYALYASANPVFERLFHLPTINLAISEGLVFFTISGIVLVTGFFFPFDYLPVSEWDKKQLNMLEGISEKADNIALKNENIKGVILFVLLNGLLFLVNCVDLTFVFSGQKLPESVDYSQFVHQGVNTLIVSILFAMSIIAYFFRGDQNFYERNQWLLRLTYLWIAQNALLLINIIYKNQLYISEYGLTYKRIGVYVFLLITLIGLISTVLKIRYTKTNWYLIRKNSWAIYFILVFSGFINWDAIIANYNIHKARTLDVNYLIHLPEGAIPELGELLSNPKVDLSICVYDYTKYNLNSSTPSYVSITQREFITRKIQQFKQNQEGKKWQSWNYADARIINYIEEKKL